MNIGSKLRYLIEEANITQRQLADALHISPSALNGYINQGKEPDYATLVRIADYFHTSTDYLLGHSNIRNASLTHLNSCEGELLSIYHTLSSYNQQLFLEELKAVDPDGFPGNSLAIKIVNLHQSSRCILHHTFLSGTFHGTNLQNSHPSCLRYNPPQAGSVLSPCIVPSKRFC